MSYKNEIKSLDSRCTRDAQDARDPDLLQSLEMRQLRERSDARSIATTGCARTARALGMRDLLRSLEMRELRERSESAIC